MVVSLFSLVNIQTQRSRLRNNTYIYTLYSSPTSSREQLQIIDTSVSLPHNSPFLPALLVGDTSANTN